MALCERGSPVMPRNSTYPWGDLEVRVGPFTTPTGVEWGVVRRKDGSRYVQAVFRSTYVIHVDLAGARDSAATPLAKACRRTED